VSVFFATTVSLWLFFWWKDQDENRLDSRLQELVGPAINSVHAKVKISRAGISLPKMATTFMSTEPEPRTSVQTKLHHAGYYRPEAITGFALVKTFFLFLPWIPAASLALMGTVSWRWALLAAALFGLLGFVGPGLWLRWKKGQRQITFRGALPDVLDVLVICLEGGASLPSALVRVTEELRLAHPELGLELAIVEREMQLGRSLGESFMHFADRTDLDEVRSLANCMTQSDRLGGGLVKTLRLQAQTMRERRLQYAEEKAQKAGTKILFPTLLLIFPAIFVILIGPAAFQVYALMQRTKQEAISGRNSNSSNDSSRTKR
jgi:tight adherence protein C